MDRSVYPERKPSCFQQLLQDQGADPPRWPNLFYRGAGMKDTLLEIQGKFGRSKPVFTGKLENSNSCIEFTCAESYDPMTADLDHNDPVVHLMVEAYSERFDKQDFFQVYD